MTSCTDRALLRVANHRRELLPRELVRLVGVICLDVLLGLVENFVLRLALNARPAYTVNHFGHVFLPVCLDGPLSQALIGTSSNGTDFRLFSRS